eukprot:9428302-Pyramimonas_sp.AAC.1
MLFNFIDSRPMILEFLNAKSAVDDFMEDVNDDCVSKDGPDGYDLRVFAVGDCDQLAACLAA